MNVTAQKFQSLCALVCKSLARSNQRTTLPQSALAGCQLPQRGSRDNIPHNINHPPAGYLVSGRVIFAGSAWGYILPFNRVLAKPWVFGRFSSPLRNSKTVSLYHSTDDTPSASLRSAAPSEREPGAAAPFNVPPKSRNVTGDFHRPYENSVFLHFTAHRGAVMFEKRKRNRKSGHF